MEVVLYMRNWKQSQKNNSNSRSHKRQRSHIELSSMNDDNIKNEIKLRKRLSRFLIKGQNSTGNQQLMGCTSEFIRAWFEELFRPGMTWESYGEWEIDHNYLCKSFDLFKEEEAKQCFHWSNLQPLWKKENEEKADDIPENFYWEEEKWVYKIEQ